MCISYERKTFERQSILLEYSFARFRTAQGKSDDFLSFNNMRWRWSALMLEYRFYLLDKEEIDNFNIYAGAYARYAYNISQNMMYESTILYGKQYQAGDAYEEHKNTMLGGGLSTGIVAQISSKIKIEIGGGLGLMRILTEQRRNDYIDYLNNFPYSQPHLYEKSEPIRYNPRFCVVVGYCF
jgi:hypothetical protein